MAMEYKSDAWEKRCSRSLSVFRNVLAFFPVYFGVGRIIWRGGIWKHGKEKFGAGFSGDLLSIIGCWNLGR